MKRLNRLLIFLNLKKNTHVIKKLDGEKVKNPNRNNLKRDDYNTSYYGDPYVYDWYNPEFDDFDRRRRWTG